MNEKQMTKTAAAEVWMDFGVIFFHLHMNWNTTLEKVNVEEFRQNGTGISEFSSFLMFF